MPYYPAINIPLDNYVFIKTNIFVLVIRLQGVFKKFSRRVAKIFSKRLAKTSLKSLEDVFKTSCKTSSRYIQDVFKTSCKDVFKTSWRRFQDVFHTFLRCSANRISYRKISIDFHRFLIGNSLNIPKLLKQFFYNTLWSDYFYK